MADKKVVNLTKKQNIELSIFLDVSDPENPCIVPTELEPKDSIVPATMVEIKTSWVRPNFTLQQIVDANCYAEKMQGGRTVKIYDESASISAHIRVLLKEWNMHEIDPSFALKFEKSVDNVTINVLTADTMQRIGLIDPPEILNIIVNRFMGKLIEKKFMKIPPKPEETETK